MKPLQTILIAAIVSVLAAYGTVKMAAPRNNVMASKNESAYDRVIRTKTLRCGYGISPPQFMKDANTGKMSGIDYDVWQEVGKILDIKIEWSEEAGWGNFIEGLRSNRFDAFCSHMWPDYNRTKLLSLSVPITYSDLKPYVRQDDARFDGNLSAINQPSVIIPVVDGDVSVMMAKTNFPKANLLTLPQTATVSDMFLSIITKKADVMFFTPGMFAMFEKDNAGKMRMVKDVPKAFTMAGYYGYRSGEIQLRDMVDMALQTMVDNGKLGEIVHTYSKEYRVSKGNY